MSETAIRAAGLVLVTAYAVLVGWLFAQQPASLAEAGGGLSSIVGAYRINQQAFDDGMSYFRNDQFAEARAAFARADPARRDARTQFYIAYAFYRQGWGRFYSDDMLYREGLEAVNHAIELAPDGRLVVEAPGQPIRTADELKAELEAGLRQEPSDFNPMRVFRPRK
jgi:tetratricopeptide (TPR) repeat protein